MQASFGRLTSQIPNPSSNVFPKAFVSGYKPLQGGLDRASEDLATHAKRGATLSPTLVNSFLCPPLALAPWLLSVLTVDEPAVKRFSYPSSFSAPAFWNQILASPISDSKVTPNSLTWPSSPSRNSALARPSVAVS